MKQYKLHIILAVIALSFIFSTPMFAIEKLAIITIERMIQEEPHSLTFDIMLNKRSDEWGYFANATLTFALDTTVIRDFVNSVDVEILGTELPEEVSTGGKIPTNGYIFDIFKYEERIGITILGPPTYFDCSYMILGEKALLATVKITTKDSTAIARYMSWCTPLVYYQAVAYKTEKEITFDGYADIKYDIDDNVPMLDYDDNEFSVEYLVDISYPFVYELEMFDADYITQKQISLEWATVSEINCVGYTILRYPKIENPNIDTVYTYTKGTGFFDPEMLSKGISESGFSYGLLYDHVEYSGGSYCYMLYAMMNKEGNTYDTLLAEDCVSIPTLLIASAKPLQNPFSTYTTIEYELLYDAYVTVTVYDVVGRKVKVLSDDATDQKLDGNAVISKGFQNTTFTANTMYAQGMYNVVIRAIPAVSSETVIEEGYVDVKVQLLIEE